MGCRAGVIVCALAATAFAETPPDELPTTITPRPAPPDVSWYGTIAPAAPPAVTDSRPYRARVGRGGAFLLAGLTHVEAATKGRVDIGVPTPLKNARRLRGVVIVEGGDQSTKMVEQKDLAITPQLQYDWRIFGIAGGDVVLVAGAGMQWARTWVRRPDEPYWPSSWESSSGFSGRLDVAFQYRDDSGLVVSLHPLSVVLPIGTPPPPDARWMPDEASPHIGVSATIGYQFK